MTCCASDGHFSGMMGRPQLILMPSHAIRRPSGTIGRGHGPSSTRAPDQGFRLRLAYTGATAMTALIADGEHLAVDVRAATALPCGVSHNAVLRARVDPWLPTPYTIRGALKRDASRWRAPTVGAPAGRPLDDIL